MVERVSGRFIKNSHLLSDVLSAVKMYQNHRSVIIIGAVLALLEQLFGVVAFYVSALALGLEVYFLSCLVVIPIAAIVARLPIALWGIGLREGVEVLLFTSLLSMDPGKVAAASFLMTATMYIATLPGFAFWLFDSKEVKQNLMRLNNHN